MKMRKKLAALLAAAMIASVMPMTAFAKSDNDVTKVVTVKEDASTKDAPPVLKVDVKDSIASQQSFFLNLTGAEWGSAEEIQDAIVAENIATDIALEPGPVADAKSVRFVVGTFVFEAYRETGTTLDVRHLGEENAAYTGGLYDPGYTAQNNDAPFVGLVRIPLVAKVTGAEAFVEVERYDTKVSETKHLFAVSSGNKAKVIVGGVPSLYRRVEMAKITLEELYAGSFDGADRAIEIELRDTDFEFNLVSPKLQGQRAYRNLTGSVHYGSDNKGNTDRTKLVVLLPASLTNATAQRGLFELTGVEVVADKDSRMGEVRATINSNSDGIIAKETLVVAKRAEYNTLLSVADDYDYEVVAGNEKEVKFKLSEELANSLIGTRPVTFTFDQDVKIKGEYTYNAPDFDLDAITDEVINVNGSDVTDKGDWTTVMLGNRVTVSKDRTSFTVDEFDLIQNEKGSYEFTTTILVPASVTGDIMLKADGKGVDEQQIVIAKVEAPVEVETTGMDIKVGLKEIETTGKITIKETKEDRFDQGKDIVIRIDDIDNGLKIKSFKAKVVEGDLVLAEDAYTTRTNKDEAIGIKRASTELSTIEITDIVMYTNRTVPEGKYDLLVGGDAISRITDRHNKEFVKIADRDMDPAVVVKDFINITTKNTEDISGSANKAVVGFVVGSDQYLVNGKAETMNAPPYIKDGNTMVPVRYVAMALGVTEDKVVWDQENKTATIIADKVVQVKLGSKAMIVNGVTVPMNVSAELTNDRTFVPMGAIARALGVVVEWDNDNKIATFNPAK